MAKDFIRISKNANKKIERIIRNQPGRRAEVYDAVLEIFKRMAPRAAAHVVKTQLSGGSPKAFGPNKQVKRRRTGQLARSIMGRGVMRGGVPVMEVGVLRVTNPTLTRYAWTQEFGTKSENPLSPVSDIVPRAASAMAVPFGDNLTGAGVVRRTIDDFGEGELKAITFKSPRGRNANVIGRLILKAEYDAEREAAAAQNRSPDFRALEPVFLLLTRVQIKPGWYLHDGLRDFLPQVTTEVMRTLSERFIGRKGR